MSDYIHNKQVLYPITKDLLEKLDCEDSYELEDKFNIKGKFGTEGFIDYEGTKDYNEYISYELSSTYGEESGDFGRSRFLKPSEQEKYKKIFSKAIPEEFIDSSLFKYVDYCYYNCCEADDYYIKKDSFEEEI